MTKTDLTLGSLFDGSGGFPLGGMICGITPIWASEIEPASSSALLTDLTALDYDALERTLEFLANNSAAVAAQALPGQWNAASGTYTVTDASRAAMQTFFNVSPTEAQASSFSEP